MRIESDLNALATAQADVCVVGAGLVGLCLAVDLAERGLSVVILESGFRAPTKKMKLAAEAVIDQPRFHEKMSAAQCRAVGGTSWLWAGRCTELDEVDFSPRDYLPESAWPVSYRDISLFYPRAAELLG